jgi:hypothetical protein
MTDNRAARETLVRARAILQERLVERLVDVREDFLADAAGGVFEGEINAVFDHIGSRLSQVSQMLAVLPEQQPSDNAEESSPSESVASLPAEESAPPQLAMLAGCVQSNDVDGATKLIARLFDTDMRAAGRHADFLFRRVAESTDTLPQLGQLQEAVSRQRANDALVILNSCFGCNGPELVATLTALQAAGASRQGA